MLGGFKNGRIEEFLNCYTLNSDDVSKPVLLKRIAGALFDFHMVKVDEEVKPNLFSCTRHMLNLAKELSFDDPVKKEAYQAIDLEKLDEEVSEMEKICAASSSPVVYSHNDLLPGMKYNCDQIVTFKSIFLTTCTILWITHYKS